MENGARLADRSEIPEDSTFLVTVRDDEGEEREAILLDHGQEVRAWFNYCQHWRDVKLDKGSGALIRDEEVICQKHAATFETESGVCTYGPCEGAVLDQLDVAANGDGVYLVDEDYSFVRVGPADEDEDLSSGSRIDF